MQTPTTEYSPIVQWRLNEKLQGSYYVKYGTGDIAWKKIDTDTAQMLLAVGCVSLPPLLAGPAYTGRMVQVYV
jgi:hypothetical protein